VNAATNQTGSVDANGNTLSSYNGNQEYSLSYDPENRVSGVANINGNPFTLDYAYDAQNRRIWISPNSLDTYNNPIGYTVNLYSPNGQKLGAYVISNELPSYDLTSTLASSDQYFGGRRLAVLDQLGSAGTQGANQGTYFPWGEPKGSTNPQNTWSFATYWQDSTTGLDYANNRYYSNAYGRFMTPDMHTGSAHPSAPQSWNRYSYTLGDPVNANDPRGEDSEDGSEEDYCAVYAGMDPRACDNGPDCAVFGNISPAFSQFCNGQAQTQAAVVSQTFITYTPQMRVQVGGFLALNALLNNGACASLFGGDVGSKLSGVPDPYNVLSDILNGTGYASIGYGNMNPTNVTATGYNIDNAVTSPVGYNSATGLFSSASITINTSQYAPFNSGGFISDAVTLLHELGHVYEYLFGQSSTAILDDDGNKAQSQANTALVQSTCFPGVNFSNPSNPYP
jgi:RHS repeat-associated protein